MKDYYSFSEVTVRLMKLGIYCVSEELASYIQQKFIHPVIYINSLPVHACEAEPYEDGYNIYCCGYCYLTAYLDLPIDDIIGIVNMAVARKSVEFRSAIFKNQLKEGFLVSSWQKEDRFFKKVPPECCRPKSQEDAKIECFVLLEPLTIENIRISRADFEFLKYYLLEESIKMARQKNYAEQIIKKRESRSKIAKKNIKKSATLRKQQSEEEWQRVKPDILKLAKLHERKTANAIAEIACKKKYTSKSSSHIAKIIRKDRDFIPYIKK